MHIRIAEVATAIILTFVVVTVVNYGYQKWNDSQPPIQWNSVETLTPVVKKSGELRARYKAIVYKQCPADLTHFLIAPDGTSPVRFTDLRGGYRLTSDGEEIAIDFKIKIPTVPTEPLVPYPPGEYIYRIIAVRYCGVEPYLDNQIPDVKFKLEE